MRQRPDMDFLHEEDDFAPGQQSGFIEQVCKLCLIAAIVLATPIAIDVLGHLIMEATK